MTETEFIAYVNRVCTAVLGEVRNAEALDFIRRLGRSQLARMVAAGDICVRREALLGLILDDILHWETAV